MYLFEQILHELEIILSSPDAQVSALVGLCAVGLFWWVGALRIRRSTQRIHKILVEGTADPLRFVAGVRRGFSADILTPTDLFRQISVTYTPPSLWNPLAIVAAIFGRSRGRLRIQAQFRRPPTAEFIWVRNGVPGQLFGKESNPSSWVHRHLVLTKSEYATRGSHVEPLIRTFGELQSRFSPALRRISIQRTEEKEIEMVVAMNPLAPAALPHLMASLWSLGQSATRT